MNVLVIIDPQIDFVSGTLAVPGATEAMSWLASWIKAHQAEYEAIFVSMDQHPMNHCSFQSEGGPWPRHCVRYSAGAAIEPSILEALVVAQSEGKPIHYIEKATTPEADCYSAFAEYIPEAIASAERIYLAGLAGDYCVAASEADLLRAIPSERIVRLEEGIAWINK